ncbi:charged multivesicular body protein 4b-like [Pempheris klunzingeri]|uniref:charged multivesicular body protein 4b-like n=1 Tax=Pempheris klunzingeri TaxID=3127111 RepID=UPI0039802DAE
MSLFNIFKASGEEKVRRKPCLQEERDKFTERGESLSKKKEFLKKKIDQELLFIKKHSRKNRRVALQALRRKKWYEKHLKYIECAFNAMRSAHENIDLINNVNDLIKDIPEEQDGAQDTSDTLGTSVSFGVEFDEDELLAELERLEKNLDESLLENDRMEERGPCPIVSSTASPSLPETSPSSQSNTESDPANSSPRYPIIIITAPSREDIYASDSKMTIADAVKERRPSSTPIVSSASGLQKHTVSPPVKTPGKPSVGLLVA